MKKLTNGDLVATEPHERQILEIVESLLSRRRPGGQYADWKLLIKCSENGSWIKTTIRGLDVGPGKIKVERPPAARTGKKGENRWNLSKG